MAVQRDPLHPTARYNLAATFILKKEYARAQGECDSLLEKNPQDVYALDNKAIAFYYYGKEEDIDTTQKAIQILESAHRLAPRNFEILYNLASLKEDRNRMAGAKRYWEKYLALPDCPRDNFFDYVYEKIHGTPPVKPVMKGDFPRMPASIQLGDDFLHLEKKWGQEWTAKYKVSSEASENNQNWSIHLQVMVKENLRILALDDTIEIVEQELADGSTISAILKRLGPPQEVVCHTQGNFYIYKDKGFSIKEINGIVSSFIWYEKSF